MPADLTTLLAVIAGIAFVAAIARAMGGDQAASFHSVVGPFSTDEAHRVWQDHSDCAMNYCPAKNTAYWALADAGKLVPDARVTR
jgi:hypothetical protein